MKQMVFLRFEAAGFSVDRTVPRDPSRAGGCVADSVYPTKLFASEILFSM
jgi:hypothetical protein